MWMEIFVRIMIEHALTLTGYFKRRIEYFVILVVKGI